VNDATNDTHGRISAPCGEAEKAALVEYLYGEIDDDARARVEAHLSACGECRLELDQMRGARAQLATWSVPQPELGFALISARERRQAAARRYWVPAGLAAAAALILAAGAAIAHLEIRYDDEGVSVRTGWGRPEAGAMAQVPVATPEPARTRTMTASSEESPWRDELAALERRLRTEFTATPAPAAGPTINQAELLRRVQALIEESESRQRRELALRVAQVVRDFDTQRQSDLVRIQRGLGALEGSSAADRQLLNYLMRVSNPRQ
jgi:hypothetical protein